MLALEMKGVVKVLPDHRMIRGSAAIIF